MGEPMVPPWTPSFAAEHRGLSGLPAGQAGLRPRQLGGIASEQSSRDSV
jgi:hypothetical protein